MYPTSLHTCMYVCVYTRTYMVWGKKSLCMQEYTRSMHEHIFPGFQVVYKTCGQTLNSGRLSAVWLRCLRLHDDNAALLTPLGVGTHILWHSAAESAQQMAFEFNFQNFKSVVSIAWNRFQTYSVLTVGYLDVCVLHRGFFCQCTWFTGKAAYSATVILTAVW
jgi:hypothetical protein